MSLPRFGAVALSACLILGSAFLLDDLSRAADRPAEGRLSVAEFERLHAKLTKMSTEKVWSIPWRLSVREARELAAKERKPVFLWISSNGGTHPLGPC